MYNTRKRQEGGDSAENYFACTEQVAGVQDTRFQALMPDPLHFLGGKSSKVLIIHLFAGKTHNTSFRYSDEDSQLYFDE